MSQDKDRRSQDFGTCQNVTEDVSLLVDNGNECVSSPRGHAPRIRDLLNPTPRGYQKECSGYERNNQPGPTSSSNDIEQVKVTRVKH